MGARLGQHFLTSEGAAHSLVNALPLQTGDTIVEIGPGKGALTKVLLKTGNRVVAIEKDELLAETLHETFRAECAAAQLQIVTGDVRDFDPQQHTRGPYVLAANIPYYITGEILRMFLTASKQPHAMALLMQKEVAERIVARDKKESLLSLSVKAYGTPKIVAKVKRGSFSPPPKVDSAILLIDTISRDFFTSISENEFFEVLHAGFAAKRKQLGGALEKVFGTRAREALGQCSISEKARAEDLSLEQWKKLTETLSSWGR
ncbi:ribosomal RNA small subunit methyltransferase A [bacterium]|nr:ribosomal RNA small subunit methyltransferase A [bacterium]